MRRVLTVSLIAGLASTSLALAQPGGQQPGQTPPPPPSQPVPAATPIPAPPTPKEVPVPDGPVVKTATLEGGLLCEDIKIGDGFEVKPGESVLAYYHGTLKSDGSVFDSAFKRGEPAPFSLNQVIEGWKVGVPGMKVGGIRRLTVPAKMAYGEQARQTIPANSDLVFVIQMMDVLHTDDVKVGTGTEAQPPCVAVTSYVLKDAEGKVVDKCDATDPHIWIPNEFMGEHYGIDGMRVGGKRILTIPKEFNKWNPAFAGERPQNVPVVMELELTAVRNLQPPRPPKKVEATPVPTPPPAPATPAPTTPPPAPK